MSGLKDVVDDMKFEAWLRTCAGMSPESKRKRLSQIDSSHRKRSAAAEERDREFSIDVLDDEERAKLVSARAMGEFARTKVVPEVDGVKYSRLSVVQRYANGQRHIVNGLFKGVSINRGAVATFWPAPKPYFVIVGEDSAEMCHCVKQVDSHAGACIVTDGGVEKAALPLEIYGVMANMTVSELTAAASSIDAALEDLGNRNEGEPVVNKLLSLFISLHRFRLMH